MRWLEAFGDALPGIDWIPPLARQQWLALAQGSCCVLSDSGGAAEELPYLGVPLIVYRYSSERTEAFDSGHARWISPDDASSLDEAIEQAVSARYRLPPAWPLCTTSPYGDGNAGPRAAATIVRWLRLDLSLAPHNEGTRWTA